MARRPGRSPRKAQPDGRAHGHRSPGINEGNVPVYTGQDIRFTARDNILYATALDWPGDKVTIKSLAPRGQTWTGLYPRNRLCHHARRCRELRWEMTKDGLVVETPRAKPCDYAFVFKIVRKTPFRGEAL